MPEPLLTSGRPQDGGGRVGTLSTLTLGNSVHTSVARALVTVRAIVLVKTGLAAADIATAFSRHQALRANAAATAFAATPILEVAFVLAAIAHKVLTLHALVVRGLAAGFACAAAFALLLELRSGSGSELVSKGHKLG